MKQRPNNWPKRVGAFLNNYRAVIFLAAAILLSSSAFSQVDTTKLLQYINAYGYRYKNGAFDSSFRVPADTFKLSYKDTSALAIKNKVLYTWSGSNWKAVALKVNDTTFIINGDTVRVTTGGGGGGSGTTDLTFSRNSTTVTVISSTGTDAVLPAATTSNAGVMTGAMKLSLDSTFTKRFRLNDSTVVYYNSLGVEVYREVDTSFAFAPPLYAIDRWTAGVKNDSAAWNAKAIQGRAMAATAPTDGQAIVWDNGASTWKPGTVAGGGLSGLTTNRVPYATSSTTVGDDAGLTYNSTTNTVTTDSIVMNNISLQRMLRNLGGGIASDSIGFGACVIRGNASGGSGSLISWSFIDDADHTKTFFTNVYGNSSGSTIHLSYPEVGKILSMTAVPDESLAGRGIFLGASVGDTSAEIYSYQHIISSGMLQGNGTNFTVSGALTGWTTNFNSGTGAVSFLPPANLYYNTASDDKHISANYSGTNNYRLRRKVSGLGSDIVGYVMVDNVTNTDVTGAPTSSDIIEVTGLPFYRQVSGYQVSGSLYEASIWSANSNIWIFFTYKR